MKKSFADILDNLEDKQRKKIARKLPEWAGVEGLQIPSSLNLEQCSSTAAARYKASLLTSFVQKGVQADAGQRADAAGGGPAPVSITVCDITGGLGVDSWAFSKAADKVWHYERDSGLSGAAASNFRLLGADNIITVNQEVGPGTPLPQCDMIFADPARRDDCGRKVFLLEDCSPDILTLLPSLWRVTDRIMLKLSPMADISMVASRLGKELKEVHIVCLDSEVKELLCLLEKGHCGDYSTVIPLESAERLSFRRPDEAEAPVRYAGADSLKPGAILLEPGAALLKSGAFKLPCSLYGLEKISPDVHYYILPEKAESADIPEGLFKSYRILEISPFSSRSIKEFGSKYPGAGGITARGLPVSSEQLRARMRLRGTSPDLHLFAFPGLLLAARNVAQYAAHLRLCNIPQK